MDQYVDEDITGAIDASEAPAPPPMDDSGAMPVAEPTSGGVIDTGDNSGAAPAVPAQQAPARQGGQMNPIVAAGKELMDGNTTGQALGKFGGNVKRIVSYLMGEGADPQMMQQSGAQADPQGMMSPDDRNVQGVAKIAETVGPDAAWKVVQAHRVSYNAKQAFAYSALNGTQQKPPDIEAAVDAANKASSHILDGSNVRFARSQQGVTATVNGPEGPMQYNLTPDQFRTYLNVGREGQWDKVMERTVPGTLKQLTETGRLGASPPRAGAPPRPQQAPAIDNSESDAYDPRADENVPKTNFGKTPSTLNLSGNDHRSIPQEDRRSTNERRADEIYPWISQNDDRARFLAGADERDATRKATVDAAREKGVVDTERARITAGANVKKTEIQGGTARDVAQMKQEGYAFRDKNKATDAANKLAVRIRELDSKNANADLNRELGFIKTQLLTGGVLNPQQKQTAERYGVRGLEASEVVRPGAQRHSLPPEGRQTRAGHSTTPQQNKPAAPAAGKPPVQGARLHNGKWYTRGANGEAVPVQ